MEAAEQGIQSILLFGYHGKLIKLAGGIFHTHHHVADGRQEVLAAHGAAQGLPTEQVQTLLQSPTVEAGLTSLRQLSEGEAWVAKIYGAIATQIDQRSAAYIRTHTQKTVTVGCILFDRQRKIIVKSSKGASLLEQFC